jgi:hypothetical protein
MHNVALLHKPAVALRLTMQAASMNILAGYHIDTQTPTEE